MPKSWKLREITSADMSAIFAVRVATWHNPNGREEMEKMGITHQSVCEMIASSHKGWLAESENGEVIGFAMGNKTNGEIWVIAVLEKFEGQGVGRDLIAMVERWLKAEGWKEIWLTTDTDESLRAVGFYRHLGWEDWKIEDGDRFMRKQLSR